MRIVQFMVGSYGGAERFFVRLCGALASRGLDHLVIVNDDPELVASVRGAGLDHAVLSLSKFGGVADRMAVGRICRDFRADIVAAWMNRAARRLPRGPYATLGRLGGYYPVKHYRRCDYIIANTPGICQSCVDQGWPQDRLRLISNFSEPFADEPVQAERFGIEGNPFVVCALGRFDAWKGFDTLIEAMARVDGALLLLAGQGGGEAALRERVARLGIADRVRFLGWLDDRASLLRRADLCVVPSHHEPLGNVILEAWSAKCPVIAAASEGPNWLIEDGSTGRLLEPGNVEALAAALRQARDDIQARRGWAEAGYARWQDGFTEDVICGKYIDFFAEAIQARSADEIGAIARIKRRIVPAW